MRPHAEVSALLTRVDHESDSGLRLQRCSRGSIRPAVSLPYVRLGPDERLDFILRQIDPLFAQRDQCFAGPFDKAPA